MIVQKPTVVSRPSPTAGSMTVSVTQPIAPAVPTVAAAHSTDPSTATENGFGCSLIPLQTTFRPRRRTARSAASRGTGWLAVDMRG
ncbi:hypothetical protein GCM10009584_25770 [Ornithinimicrobium humiphilum]